MQVVVKLGTDHIGLISDAEAQDRVSRAVRAVKASPRPDAVIFGNEPIVFQDREGGQWAIYPMGESSMDRQSL